MKLRTYMDQYKVSEGAIADAAGLSISGVRKLRYGERKPSLEVAMRIEAFTNGLVKPVDFLAANPPTGKHAGEAA
jgi:predicted transcriptional regulator